MPEERQDRPEKVSAADTEQDRQVGDPLATVVSAGEAGWWDLDLGSGIALHSPRHDELFGFTAPPAVWDRETAAQRIVPEDRGRYLEAFDHAARTGRFECDFRVVWPDGTHHWLSERGKAYRYDENGRPLRIAGIVMEASEEVRRRERLEKALARDHAIIDAIPEGFLVAAADGTVLAINPAGLRLHGFDSPQAVRTVADFSVFTMHGLDGTLLPASAWPLARILRGEIISGVRARVTRAGTGWTWMGSFSGAPVRGYAGEVALAVMTFRDVTKEKQLEEDLQRNVRELTGTLELTQALISTMDGTIVFCTSATGRLYGWPRADLIGKNLHALLQTEFPQPLEEVTAILLRDGEWTGELKQRRRDGSVIWVASHWALHYDERGNPATITEVNHNITALKHAEEEVRRSRDQLLLAHKVGDIASWVFDPTNWRAEGPPEAFELFQIGPEAASPANELFARVHPDDLGPLTDAIMRGAAEGSFELEYRYRLRSGEIAWMATKGRLQPDGRLLGVTQNITTRKRTGQALRDSEEQFRTLADSIPQLAWIARADGYFYWYNRRWYEYTGTTLEQMQGWGWQYVHDATQLPAVLERWRNSIATGEPFDMTFPLRGADGVFRPFLSRAVPVRNPEGRVVRWCGTHTDISERLKYEEAMHRAEARLSRLVESNVVGLVVATSDRVLEANDYFLKMVGYTREEFEAGRIDWSTITPPEYAAVEAECKRQYHETGVCQAFEKEYLRKDGTRVPILVGGVVIETDPETQFLSFIVDLTERKMLERHMMQTQKMESVGLLAGGIAHDFNNLLVGVIGNASLAGSMLPKGDPAKELIDRVVNAGEQAAHLTRQILAYSGKGRFLLERLNLSALAPEMIRLIEPSISKKVVVRMDLDPDLPLVQADRGQIQQIFVNLLLNAAEAVGSGAGEVTIRTGVAELDEAWLRGGLDIGEILPGRYVYLEMRDTGSGMDAATRLRIFDPFFTTKFTGRGLGLAAVAGVVRGHKGAIRVQSEPDRGSIFTVLLPVAGEAAPTAPDASRQAKEPSRGTVLVVDDEEIVRETAREALERYGYDVLMAESGPAAIEIFSGHPGKIAAVLLDLSMPGMGGDEALPELLRIRPEVKIVVSSGDSETETIKRLEGKHVAGFIPKPYTAMGLAERIAEALE